MADFDNPYEDHDEMAHHLDLTSDLFEPEHDYVELYRSVVATGHRPCPFCHASPEDISLGEIEDEDEEAFYLQCDNCLACGPQEANELDAREAWENDR